MPTGLENSLDRLLTAERVDRLRREGVIFFDVDDTLLARKREPQEADQSFSESRAARLIPALLDARLPVCLVTGHGWKQLEKRFVLPLLRELSRRSPNDPAVSENFFVYANRGATKIVFDGGRYWESASYAGKYSLDERDLAMLGKILSDLGDLLARDFDRRRAWYLQNFPAFPFADFPAQIFTRENAVQGLRPIPSNYYASPGVPESPRALLLARGLEALEKSSLSARYQLDRCGRSTLEITRRDISKKLAFADLFASVARKKGVTVEAVEAASVYIGDEFETEGNDAVIPREFPRCLCLSVGRETDPASLPGSVVSIRRLSPHDGVEATAEAISRIIKFLT